MDNDEIDRILKLLEDGKITPKEAEGLIRAIRKGTQVAGEAPKTRKWACGGTGEGPDLIRSVLNGLKAAARRQRRLAWWRYYRFADQLRTLRHDRRRRLSPEDRLRHLFADRGLADPDELKPEAKLADLGFDVVAWEVLRHALEEEFETALADETVRSFTTYGNVLAWVSAQARAGQGEDSERASPPEPPANVPGAAPPPPPDAPEPPPAPDAPTEPDQPEPPSQSTE